MYLITFVAVMLGFGYIISSFIPTYFNIPSRPFNLGFRLIYLSISLYVIAAGNKEFFEKKQPALFWVLMTFLVLYSTRLLYDSLVLDIVFKNSLFFLYSFTFGGTFIPFIAIAIYAKKLNYSLLLKFTYYVLFISSILILILLYKIIGGISLELFVGRLSFLSSDSKGETINPITLSLYGNMTALISLYYLLFKKSIKKILLVGSLILGLLLLVAGASRGPQITFGLVSLVLIYKYIFHLRKTLSVKFRFSIIVASIVSIIIYLLSKINLEEITTYQRFANFGKDASSDTSTREESWSRAINFFIENPFFGNSYLDTYDNGYPHNVYLEALMSLGFFGLLFIIPIAIFSLYKTKNHNQVGMHSMFLIASISAVFSGSIFINPLLWTMLALMIGFHSIAGKPLKRSTQYSGS